MDLCRFCGVCADDRRFFGLVTGAAPGSAAEREAEAGSSRRVFAPYFIQWQSPIMEWLSPIRDWQVATVYTCPC